MVSQPVEADLFFYQLLFRPCHSVYRHIRWSGTSRGHTDRFAGFVVQHTTSLKSPLAFRYCPQSGEGVATSSSALGTAWYGTVWDVRFL